MLHADWLARRATLHPARPALVDGPSGVPTSYAALHAGANRAAAALAARGLRAGDRLAVHARNRVETVELLFACARLGVLLVPLNWRLARAELAPILADASPALLLVDPLGQAATAGLAPSVPVAALEGSSSWSAECAAAGAPPAFVARPADTPLLVLYTSGSTGRPKGALLTHGSLQFNAINTVVGWDLGSRDRTITAAPFFHTGGWNVLTLPLLYAGGTVTLEPAFDPARVLDAIEAGAVSVLFGVPTMFAAMLAVPGWAGRDLSGLRFAISGGAPCPTPLHEAWADRVPFLQGYGLTEVGPNCFMAPPEEGRLRPGSVGVPMPHLRTRVVDAAGQPTPVGDVGELQLAGPTVVPGYWRNDEATAAAFDGGWFRTGDLFAVDADGWHACVGRKKEMFISGGENVYPAEVERVLQGIPGVAEAVVVPAADARWGEVGHAFVAWRSAAEPLAVDAVRALCRGELAGYKVPKFVTFLPQLPQGATGKIDKRQLAALAAR